MSEVATSCLGTVTGFGIAGYALALRGLKDRAKAALGARESQARDTVRQVEASMQGKILPGAVNAARWMRRGG